MKHQAENEVSKDKLFIKSRIILIVLMLVISFFPNIIQASDKETEKALQRHLEESRQITGKAKEKVHAGIPVMEDIEKLKEKAEDIRQLNLFLETS